MINYMGIISIIVFYLLILGVGMWAARKKGGDELDQEVCIARLVLFGKLDLFHELLFGLIFKKTRLHWSDRVQCFCLHDPIDEKADMLFFNYRKKSCWLVVTSACLLASLP